MFYQKESRWFMFALCALSATLAGCGGENTGKQSTAEECAAPPCDDAADMGTKADMVEDMTPLDQADDEEQASRCGDGVCDVLESTATCAQDCPPTMEEDPEPEPGEQVWDGQIEAALDLYDGSVHFFSHGLYRVYDFHQHTLSEARPVWQGDWPRTWLEGPDATLRHPNGKVYFFKGVSVMEFEFYVGDVTALTLTRNTWPHLEVERGLDAAISLPDGQACFFLGDHYQVYDLEQKQVTAQGSLGEGAWPGLWPDGVDAAVNHPNGKVYFFKGDQYRRYDMEAQEVDAQGDIGDLSWFGEGVQLRPQQWSDLPIQAAVSHPDGSAHFFSGSLSRSYNFTEDSAQEPTHATDQWRGLWPDGVDAAINHPNGKVYFFRGDRYLRYIFGTASVDKVANIKDFWPGLWSTGMDAAVNHANGKGYFFKGDRYQEYDFGLDQVTTEGQIGQDGWTGLWTDGMDAAVNHPNGKAYFFKGDQYRSYNFELEAVDEEGTLGDAAWFNLQ